MAERISADGTSDTIGAIGSKQTKNLSPEVVKVGKDYAFTIAPSDDHQYWNCTEMSDRLTTFRDYWQAYIQILTAEIFLIVEITSFGRLHFHGKIRFKTQGDVNNYFVINVRPLNNRCTSMICEIKDEGWEEYLAKGSHMNLGSIQTTNANIKRLGTIVEVSKKMKLQGPVVSYVDYFNHPDAKVETERLVKKQLKSNEKQKKLADERAQQIKDDMD